MMWNTMQKIRRLGADLMYQYQHKGFLQATKWLIEVFLIAPYHRIEWIVLARSLESPLPSFEPSLSVTYRTASLDDLSLLSDLVPPSELAYFRRRLSHKRICIMAINEHKVVGYGWVTATVNFDIDNLELRLGATDAYTDDLYVAPAFRRYGLGRALNMKRLEYLRDGNFKRAISVVRSDNGAALKVAQRNGFIEVDRMTFRRILFWRRFHYHLGFF